MLNNIQKKFFLILGIYGLITLCSLYFTSFSNLVINGMNLLLLEVEYILNEILDFFPFLAKFNHVLVMILTPVLIVTLPTAVYWYFKKQMPEYLIQIIWGLWTLTVMTYLLNY